MPRGATALLTVGASPCGRALYGRPGRCGGGAGGQGRMVYSIAHGREVIEEIVKEELTKNRAGRLLPFAGQDRVDSPLSNSPRGITPRTNQTRARRHR